MVVCPRSQSDDNTLLIVTPSDGITGTAYSYFYNDSGVTFRVLLSMIINVQRPKTTNKFIQINDAKKKMAPHVGRGRNHLLSLFSCSFSCRPYHLAVCTLKKLSKPVIHSICSRHHRNNASGTRRSRSVARSDRHFIVACLED